MSQWVPDPDAPLVDGRRVRIGDGPHEGGWQGYLHSFHDLYLGRVTLDNGRLVDVPHGCPVTVLREVRAERDWQPGDVVRDVNGSRWLRVAPDSWLLGRYTERLPVGPLTLIDLATPDADR